MVYTYDYDTSYSSGPAIPVTEFRMRAVGKDEGISLQAFVDSGADVTIIPWQYLEQAEIGRVGRAKMRWGSHSSRTYDVYLAVIEIGPIQFMACAYWPINETRKLYWAVMF